MTSGVFPPDIIAFAQSAQKRWGCPASVSLAQWALESSWGSRMSGQNNPFGIKASTGTAVVTHEQTAGGASYATTATFADYRSVEQSFDAHGAFLSHPRYAPARAVASDPKAFAHQLQVCGYATDKQYAVKLVSIMDAHDLYRYDQVGSAPPFMPPHIVPPSKPVHKGKTAAVVVTGAASVGAVVAPHVVHVTAWPFIAVAAIGAAVAAFFHFKK